MSSDILQIGGAVALISLIIRELFSYLKARGKVEDTSNQDIFKELQLMNSNHLTHIQKAIEEGNKELVTAIHSDNLQMIELLGEIKGHLSARR